MKPKKSKRSRTAPTNKAEHIANPAADPTTVLTSEGQPNSVGNEPSSDGTDAHHRPAPENAGDAVKLSKTAEVKQEQKPDTQVQEKEKVEQVLEKSSTDVLQEKKERKSELDTLRRRLKQLKETHRMLASCENPLDGEDLYDAVRDRFSVHEVINMVRNLNTELVTLSATIADDISRRVRSKKEPFSPFRSSSKKWFQDLVIELLAAQDAAEDPIILQLVIQSILTSTLDRIFSSFCVGLPPDLDRAFHNIYKKILETEHQATAARWRSLAHSQISSRFRTNEIFQWMMYYIIGCVSEAMLRSGCSPEDSRPYNLRARFGAQITSFIKSALAIVDVFRESTLSTDFSIMVPRFKDTFLPRFMDDTHRNTSSESKVLLATEIGLRCKTKMPKGQAKGTFARKLLIKPKVVLDSILPVV